MRTSDASSGSSSSLLPREHPERGFGEPLSEHGGVVEQAPFVRCEAVEPGGDQGVQRLRNLELLDLCGEAVGRTLLNEQAAVEQHSHRLDCVERHALRPGEHLVANALRKTGNEAAQELVHGRGRERLEVDRGEASLSGTPGRATFEQLRPREGDDEQRVVAGPVEQVLDEIEQAFVGPLHVLEHEHRRISVGQPLEEQSPRGEQVVSVAGLVLPDPKQVREPGLDECPLLGVADVEVERRAELRRTQTPRLLPPRSSNACAPCRRVPSR